MKKVVSFTVLCLLFVATLLSSGSVLAAPEASQGPLSGGKMVIANRASGTISVIDVRTDQVIGTYALPAGDNPAEPMYVVYVPQADRVFVGDRGNDRVVIFDRRDFSVEGSVPAGAGVFHMWADLLGHQLWINNDADNTSTVIDPVTLEHLATVPTPADLVAQGGFPHDVVLDPVGRYAYVSVLGLSGDSDYIVQFSTQTFQEIRRAAVGKDPHVSLTWRNHLLYVPSQGSNGVWVLDRRTMDLVTVIPVPGAHGAGMPLHGRVFYTTNLPGGGTDGLFAIDTGSNTVIGEATDTPYPVPHNIAFTANSRKLYLTHSGPASDKVTVYAVSRFNPQPAFLGEVTVGFNPFGLTFVP
jgi:YVTN family beta-propeller protein